MTEPPKRPGVRRLTTAHDCRRLLAGQVNTKSGGKVVRLNHPQNMLEKQKSWALLSLLAPLAGVGAALSLAVKKDKEDR